MGWGSECNKKRISYFERVMSKDEVYSSDISLYNFSYIRHALGSYDPPVFIGELPAEMELIKYLKKYLHPFVTNGLLKSLIYIAKGS
jgi:hypothetical protein